MDAERAIESPQGPASSLSRCRLKAVKGAVLELNPVHYSNRR
jgi:hypothetical protein